MADENIDEIIKNLPGNEENPDPNPDGQEEKDPENQNPEEGGDQDNGSNEDDDESKQRNAAFAKMRVENQTLKRELDELRASQKANQDDEGKEEKDQKTDNENKEIDPEDLKAQIKNLEEKLEETSKFVEQSRSEKHKQAIVDNLTNLKTKYELTPDDLVQFAEDAEKQGINLSENPAGIEGIYRSVYFDKIVQREVERELKEKGIQTGRPGTGPRGQTKSTGKSSDIDSILDEVAKKSK